MEIERKNTRLLKMMNLDSSISFFWVYGSINIGEAFYRAELVQTYTISSYLNMMLFTNNEAPIKIEDGDRR